jgi:hypothetical protein
MFMLACLVVVLAVTAIIARTPRPGVHVNDLSKVDRSKRPPPPAPMRRAGIERPYSKDLT